MLANFAFSGTLEIQFRQSWGLRDSDIKGLQSVPFSLEVHISMQTGIDDSQLVTLGSRKRVVGLYITYFMFLVSYLCAIPKREHFSWDQSFHNFLQKYF